MCQSLGFIPFVIKKEVAFAIYSIMYRCLGVLDFGSDGTMKGCAIWLGWPWCRAFQLHSIFLFNEDGMMWLMRRTGWARTNIWHGNGRNDRAWLHGWACQVYMNYFQREKS